MKHRTLAIGPRGQITLPKELRSIFNSTAVTLELIDENHAVITPIRNIGGLISEYKKNDKMPFEEIREIAWSKTYLKGSDKNEQ